MNRVPTQMTSDQATLAFQSCPNPFSLADLKSALEAQGVSSDSTGRKGPASEYAADRLVRKLKKAGRIELEGRVWKKVAEDHPVVMEAA